MEMDSEEDHVTCHKISSTGVTDMSSKKLGETHSDQESNEVKSSDPSTYLQMAAPDGGWGWMIVFASFMFNFVIDGSFSVFGVFLPHFLDYYGVGRSKISIVGSALTACFLLSGPFISMLAQCIGFRAVAMLGGALITTGYILSIMATSADVLIITFGVITGIGLGMVYLPGIVVCGQYFEQKRALAMGISTAGSGIGMLVMAMLSALLLDTLDWKNSLLLLSGVMLQSLVFGALLRPLQPQKVIYPSSNSESKTEEMDLLNENNVGLMDSPKDTGLMDSPKDAGLKLTSPIEIPSNKLINISRVATTPSPDGIRKAALINAFVAANSPCSPRQYSSSLQNGIQLPQDEQKYLCDDLVNHKVNVDGCDGHNTENCETNYQNYYNSFKNPQYSSSLGNNEDDRVCFNDLFNSKASSMYCSKIEEFNSKGYHNSSNSLKVLDPHVRNGDLKYSKLKAISHTCGNITDLPLTKANQEVLMASCHNIGQHNTIKKPSSHHRPTVLLRDKVTLSNPFLRKDIFYSGSLMHLPKDRSLPTKSRSQDDKITVDNRQTTQENLTASEEKFGCMNQQYVFTLKRMLDVTVITNVAFVIICLGNVFMQIGYFIPVLFLPDYAIRRGIQPTFAASLMSIFGISNTLGRFTAGALANIPRINSIHVSALSMITAGMFCAACAFCTEYCVLAICVACLGFVVAPIVPLTNVFLVQYLGLDKLTSAVGLLSLQKGTACLIGPPLAGVLLDGTGSYLGPFICAGAMFVISGLVQYLLLLKCPKRSSEV